MKQGLFAFKKKGKREKEKSKRLKRPSEQKILDWPTKANAKQGT
jgi:hypothetical protein